MKAMRIGIDYTAGARQGGGIGRYTRRLMEALLALESLHQYKLFAAVGIQYQRLLKTAHRQSCAVGRPGYTHKSIATVGARYNGAAPCIPHDDFS